MAQFCHSKYYLVNNDKLERKEPLTPSKKQNLQNNEDEAGVLQELARYVQARLLGEYNFIAIPIPQEDVQASTTILVSHDWQTASKLLVIIQNASGSLLGIFSRTLCLDEGLSKGSVLPYVDRAIQQGYAVMILRPNTNSVASEVTTNGAVSSVKIPIQGGETPEAHVMFVWENVIQKAENVKHICLLGYGNGAILCKDILLRQMVKSKQDESDVNNIKGFITIEASTILEEDDPADVRETLGLIGINMECSKMKQATIGFQLKYRALKLGCHSISLGCPNPTTDTSTEQDTVQIQNVAASISLALEPVCSYLQMSEVVPQSMLANQFIQSIAEKYNLNPSTAVILNNTVGIQEEERLRQLALNSNPPVEKQGFWSRLFGGSDRVDARTKSVNNNDDKLTVQDFDLLKVVGKGAFGKV